MKDTHYPALETLYLVSVSIQYTLADVNIYMKLQNFLSSSVSCQSGVVAAPAVAPVELGGSPVCAKMIWALEIKS